MLLPWLTAAWLTAFAAPCFAMQSAAAPAAPATKHSHMHAHVNEAASDADHVHCPHCPPADHATTDSTAHARCAVQESVGTLGAPVKAPDLAAQPLPAFASVVPAPLAVQPLAGHVRRAAMGPPPQVPILLRHCVLVV